MGKSIEEVMTRITRLSVDIRKTLGAEPVSGVEVYWDVGVQTMRPILLSLGGKETTLVV
jgi:hypothetical protein